MAIPMTNRPWAPTRVRISSWTGRWASIEHDDEEGMVVDVRGEGGDELSDRFEHTPVAPLPDLKDLLGDVVGLNRPGVAGPVRAIRSRRAGKRAWSIGPSAMMPILVLTGIGLPPSNQGGHWSRPLRVTAQRSLGRPAIPSYRSASPRWAGQGLRSIQEVDLLRMVDELVQHVGAVRREEDLALVRWFALGNLAEDLDHLADELRVDAVLGLL